MPENRSNGSKLGAVAGFVITIAFFLPWVRACGTDLSGVDLATNSTGQVEGSWVYWLTLLAGLFCIALFFLVETKDSLQRIRAAAARFFAGLIGFLPILNIWLNVQERGAIFEVLYGGWITALAYLGVFISFFVDLVGTTYKSQPERSD
ncbi:MAG: hypothetical protein GTO18_20390 [Anaerolineales bacterium]|nr:hypothetical protein [Anaerolineales bacterium]